MSAKWFDRWAAYVRFDRYFNMVKGRLTSAYYLPDPSGQHEQDYSAVAQPGPIDNQILLKESKEYYHNLYSQNAICNFALRDSLEENRDYYVVTRDIWDFLHKRYGGMTVRRESILLGRNGKLKPDINLERVSFALSFINPLYRLKLCSLEDTRHCASPQNTYTSRRASPSGC